MPVQQPAPGTGRYIIRAKSGPGPLATFIDSIRGDPDIALVDTIGPPGQAHTVVVELAQNKAAEFEARFSHSDELMIERDQPLSLFD